MGKYRTVDENLWGLKGRKCVTFDYNMRTYVCGGVCRDLLEARYLHALRVFSQVEEARLRVQ